MNAGGILGNRLCQFAGSTRVKGVKLSRWSEAVWLRGIFKGSDKNRDDLFAEPPPLEAKSLVLSRATSINDRDL